MTDPEPTRRQHPRLQIAGGTAGDVWVPQPTVILELSETGMQVETAFRFPIGAVHDFRLALGEHEVVARGRVVHSRITDVDREGVTYVSGVTFVDGDADLMAAIAEYLRGARDRRARLTEGKSVEAQ